MKKISLFVIAAVVTASFTANAAGSKVKVRHEEKMIEVSASALKAHINHGDVQLFAFRGEFLPQVEIDAILALEGYPPNCGPNGCVDEPNGEE